MGCTRRRARAVDGAGCGRGSPRARRLSPDQRQLYKNGQGRRRPAAGAAHAGAGHAPGTRGGVQQARPQLLVQAERTPCTVDSNNVGLVSHRECQGCVISVLCPSRSASGCIFLLQARLRDEGGHSGSGQPCGARWHIRPNRAGNLSCKFQCKTRAKSDTHPNSNLVVKSHLMTCRPRRMLLGHDHDVRDLGR